MDDSRNCQTPAASPAKPGELHFCLAVDIQMIRFHPPLLDWISRTQKVDHAVSPFIWYVEPICYVNGLDQPPNSATGFSGAFAATADDGHRSSLTVARRADGRFSRQQVAEARRDLDLAWKGLFRSAQARIVALLIEHITVANEGIAMRNRHDGLHTLAADLKDIEEETSLVSNLTGIPCPKTMWLIC